MEEIEKYAKENRIPIMQKDGILYLVNYIKENKITNILEIGSAIGYSAIMMAKANKNFKVTTIEKDKDRYNIAPCKGKSLLLQRVALAGRLVHKLQSTQGVALG